MKKILIALGILTALVIFGSDESGTQDVHDYTRAHYETVRDTSNALKP